MKLKKQPFYEKSDTKCPICNELVKQNLVDRKHKITMCYKCDYDISNKSGNSMSTAKDIRTGKRRGRAKGRYTI